jgi:predicted nicotinamide N-methyase
MTLTLPQNINVIERFDSLYQYFSRRYELEQFNLQWKSYHFTITAIKNIDQLLDELIEQGPESEGVKDERLPYWAELWPSSIALAEYLLQNHDITSGMNALELGCGVGLAGMAAARRGADVLVSDYQPDALRLTELNWLMNLGRAPAALLLDWRTASLSQKFDLIIASDVVYEKRFFDPLIVTFKNLLSPAGRVLLSEPNRNIAREFFSSLTENGFIFQSVDSKVTFKDKIYQVTIYSINNREPALSSAGRKD